MGSEHANGGARGGTINNNFYLVFSTCRVLLICDRIQFKQFFVTLCI